MAVPAQVGTKQDTSKLCRPWQARPWQATGTYFSPREFSVVSLVWIMQTMSFQRVYVETHLKAASAWNHEIMNGRSRKRHESGKSGSKMDLWCHPVSLDSV